jgi:hypothetical protein
MFVCNGERSPFLTSRQYLVVLLKPFLMASFTGSGLNFLGEITMQQTWVGVCKGILRTQLVGHIHPNSYFDPLNCIQNQQSQTLVKNVKLKRVLKTTSMMEIVQPMNKYLFGGWVLS